MTNLKWNKIITLIIGGCFFALLVISLWHKLHPKLIDRGSLPALTIFSACDDARHAGNHETRKNALEFLYTSGGKQAVETCLLDTELQKKTLKLLCKDALSSYDYGARELLQILLSLRLEEVLAKCRTI